MLQLKRIDVVFMGRLDRASFKAHLNHTPGLLLTSTRSERIKESCHSPLNPHVLWHLMVESVGRRN